MMQKPLSRPSWFFHVFIAFMLSQSACASQGEPLRPAYTVEDMLRIEGVGELRFGPNDKSIVLEYLPPYEERGQYGIERGGQILQLSLSGKGQATPLFEHKPGKKYWLGAGSPDGRRVLVFEASRERLRLAIYDFETKALTFIDAIPQVNERFEMNSPIWINEKEIVFSSAAKDLSRYGIRGRPNIADWTSALREKAFAGKSSVATVSTKPMNRWYDGDLVIYNVDTRHISILAPGRFGNLTLSVDGSQLAALRLAQRLLHFPVSKLTDLHRFDTQLYVFELENNTSQSFLPSMHVLLGSLRWSATGSKLSFFAWSRMTAMQEGTHFVMDSGSVIPTSLHGFTPGWIGLAGSVLPDEPVAAEWLSGTLVVHGLLDERPHGQGIEQTPVANVAGSNTNWCAIDTQVTTAKVLIDGRKLSWQLYRLHDGRLLVQSDRDLFVASDSAAPMPLAIDASKSIRVLNGAPGDEIKNVIAFVKSAKGVHEVGFFDLNRNELLPPLTLDPPESVIAWAPDKQQVVTRSDTEEGGRLTLRSATKGSSVIFTFNEHLSEIEHPDWDIIEYRGIDGIQTFSCILLPYHYNPQRAYPTIIDVYPGVGKECLNGSQPLGAAVPSHNSNDLLSANGYLVVRASNTYELNQINSTLYGGLRSQVDAAVDALIAAGMTDPNRIGIWGFSNGSLASLWLASISNRYKAVVPMFGASSPYLEYFGGTSPPRFQMYLGTPVGLLVQYESESGTLPLSMGRSAIADPFAYIRASPLDRARYICSPVMMVHSDLDGFTQFHYEALFSAMYRMGKRAELVRYYGEGHGLQSPGNIRDFYERVLAFFDEHVKAGGPIGQCDNVMPP